MPKTQVIAPPEGYSPAGLKKGLAWCPYCGKEMPFAYDSRLDSARCSGCGISERDYYVRRFNGFWDRADRNITAFLHAARKSRRKYKEPFPWEEQKKSEPAKETCPDCGKQFVPAGNRQERCPDCAVSRRKEKQRDLMRARRAKGA